MDCDGDSKPKRKIVKRKKKRLTEAEYIARKKFSYCAAFNNPLEKPIVSTPMGDLLNKEGAIRHMLEYDLGCYWKAYFRVEDVPGLSNLRSIEDAKELTLKEIDKTDQEQASDSDTVWWKYCCPITGLPMNGKYKFVFSWQCGCVVSERAFEMIEDKMCIVCQTPYFYDEQIVIINPTGAKDKTRNKRHMRERFTYAAMEWEAIRKSQQHSYYGPSTSGLGGANRIPIAGPSTSSSGPSTSGLSGANGTPIAGPSTSSSAGNSSSNKRSRSGQSEASPTKRNKSDKPCQSKK